MTGDVYVAHRHDVRGTHKRTGRSRGGEEEARPEETPVWLPVPESCPRSSSLHLRRIEPGIFWVCQSPILPGPEHFTGNTRGKIPPAWRNNVKCSEVGSYMARNTAFLPHCFHV